MADAKTDPLRLVEPAARQGPGPMPQAVIDAIDVALQRQVNHTMPGDRRAVGIGTGTELAALRPYFVGDDVRHLDPAATARTGEPHVRVHVPERTLTTWIVLDVSPSMAFGTTERLKADVAEGAAHALGRLAVRRAGAVGLVRFGDGHARVSPPRGARPGLVALRRTLDDGVVADGAGNRTAMADALRRLGSIARGAGLVVVISDFRDQDEWISPLGSLAQRHSIVAVEVFDPRERELPNAGVLSVVDPETGRHIRVDTSSQRLRARFAKLEKERHDTLTAELKRLRLRHIPLSTGDDWLAKLGKALR